MTPQPGDRIVTGKECRVVTRVHPGGAVEYDLLGIIEVPNFPSDPNHGKWGLMQQRICDPIVWQYYKKREGKLL